MNHGRVTQGQGIHAAVAYTYADANDRGFATGFTAADIGKIAYQQDDGSYWFLAEVNPVWRQITTGAGATSHFANGAVGPLEDVYFPPNVVAVGSATYFSRGGQSLSTYVLGTEGNQPALPVVLTADPILAPSSNYGMTLRAKARIWETADKTHVGSCEVTVDASVVTDAATVPTFALCTAPVPDISRLPVSLAGATMTVAASTAGFTVGATRPTGVACSCRVYWWLDWTLL